MYSYSVRRRCAPFADGSQEEVVAISYELDKETLTLSGAGQTVVFYKQVYTTDNSGEMVYKNQIPDTDKEALSSFIKGTFKPFQIMGLYGNTWMDSSNMVVFTFNEDGTIRISGLSELLGEDVLSFSEVDEDTISLKVNADTLELTRVDL